MVFCERVMRPTIFVLMISVSGCAMTVRPPESPNDPVTVVLVDYGRHSSLILPRPGGGSVEYAFGEWNWYALEKDSWFHAFPAMFWPTQGTLGRQRFDYPPDSRENTRLSWSEHYYRIEVDRSRASALVDRLNKRFDSHLETKLYNPLYRLEFVFDDDNYCVSYTCNHAIAAWLEELGCKISGGRLFADFTVVDQE